MGANRRVDPIITARPPDFTITLPTTVTADGGEVLVKKVGSQTVTVTAALIEGTNQSLTITNNQAVRFVYINATFGWLIT